MDAAARVHRASFDHALPWLVGLHTPDEDRWFYREQMFAACTLWGAFDGETMSGVIAFRDDWIEQLYVLPDAQGRGIGGARARAAVDDAVAPSGEDRVVVLTGVDTKGLEFDGIVVVRPDEIETESSTGRATLYVVLTRATQLLTVVEG